MNLLQLAQKVYREVGRPGDPPTSFTSPERDWQVIYEAVATAWQRLQNEVLTRQWRWMRSESVLDLTGGQSTYVGGTITASSRFGQWRPAARDYWPRALNTGLTAAWPLFFLDYSEFRRAYNTVTVASGPPQHWSVADSGDLVVGPTPDQPYKLSICWFKSPQPNFNTTTATPELPDRHHELLAWMALIDVGADEAAAEIIARAKKNADAMMSALVMEQSELPRFATISAW